MKNKSLIVFSLMLLALVLIGVTIMEPIGKQFIWLQPFIPMIVISGFFTFLVSASLFIYSAISNLRR